MELTFRNMNSTLIPDDQGTMEELSKLKPLERIRLVPVKTNQGSQSLLNTWWMIVTEVSDHMAACGVTMPLIIHPNGKFEGSRPFDKNDGHHLFTSRFLGADAEGYRKSWKRRNAPENEIIASVGDRVWAIDQLIEYATERGITVTIPRDSEYRKIKSEGAAEHQYEGVA